VTVPGTFMQLMEVPAALDLQILGTLSFYNQTKVDSPTSYTSIHPQMTQKVNHY